MESATVTFDDATWRVDFTDAAPLSARLHFDGPQPRAFGLELARAEPIVFDGEPADTARGGLWNADTVRITPHGNGTHTECLGHLVGDAPPIPTFVPDGLVACTLVTVEPIALADTDESYRGDSASDDRVVTAKALRSAVDDLTDANWVARAFALRTEPNAPDKRHRDYTGTNPPYPTAEAIDWCVDRGVDHLLVDVPSLDREDDGGELPNHRAFWDLPPADRGPLDSVEATEGGETVTEMIYAPSNLADGTYALNLQVPDFDLDAAPSRPVVYPLERI